MSEQAPVRGVDPPAFSRPAGRYGDDRRRLSRPALVGLALAAAVALAWWVWVAADRSDPDVRWEVTGFGAITDTSIDISWTVDREPGVALECVLRARDASGEEVGRDRVSVPPSAGSATQLSSTVKTVTRPVTGEVLACLEVTG